VQKKLWGAERNPPSFLSRTAPFLNLLNKFMADSSCIFMGASPYTSKEFYSTSKRI